MNPKFYRYSIAFAGLALGLSSSVQADDTRKSSGDTLLVDRVKQEQSLNAPTRGMLMSQVEKKFGAPVDKLSPAGGDSPKHPVINRWTYENFIVYFERDHVITSVAKHASATEIGPKGAN